MALRKTGQCVDQVVWTIDRAGRRFGWSGFGICRPDQCRAAIWRGGRYRELIVGLNIEDGGLSGG